ncbi:hypothetical protein SAMN04489716_9330 [Actinoplanes derwentensis]|uniref:ATP-grasp domain-containing protein n=1 Tax=Actinoplanes derwentensis TaxID=113562 RepID=A0A1H2DD98_9ACTN|nr:hypothetical protein SAMN04489716_9330 [Actinoplanes derwentensis]
MGPFDAEGSWRPADMASLPGVSDRRAAPVVAALGETLAVLCEPGDLLAAPAAPHPAFTALLALAGFTAEHLIVPELFGESPAASTPTPARWSEIRTAVAGLTLAPYAVLRSTAVLGEALGLAGTHPPYDTVVRVNSKSWSNEIVRRNGWAGAGEVAHDTTELRRLVTAHGSADVVVKDPYGVAGRGSLVVTSPRVLDSIVRHLDAQVAAGAYVEVIVQARYRRRLDFSTHWEINPDGSAEPGAVVQTDNRDFTYAGSRPATDELLRTLDETDHPEIAATVAGELSKDGYHGPVCIDGMVIEEGTVVPVLEVNARTSMGMIGLALQARAASCGLQAVLRHLPVRVGTARAFERLAGELERDNLAFDGKSPGALLVTAGTLVPPRGRLCLALFTERPSDEVVLLTAVATAAGRAGIRIFGTETTGKASA